MLKDHPITGISMTSHDPYGLFAGLTGVKYTVEFEVPHEDAHDFEDAVFAWASNWKDFAAERVGNDEEEDEELYDD